MIFIDRNRLPVPVELDPTVNARVAKESKDAKAYFGNKEQKRTQRRFLFKAFTQRNIKSTLEELFHGKCAYCESKIALTGNADFEHYRPKSTVMESPDHPGYWWLVNEWDNLLIACANCNRRSRSKDGISGKANRFPLKDESKRAFSPKDSISKETPLILNPCMDQPEDHFMYTDEGKIMSETEQGQTTIMVLGLNRLDLVRRRKNVVLQIKSTVDILLGLSKSQAGFNSESAENALLGLKEMTREEEEFAGLRRQYVRAAIQRIDQKVEMHETLRHTKSYSKVKKQAIKKNYTSYAKTIQQSSINDATEQGLNYMLKEHYVEKLELINIKTFIKQTFNFIASEGSSAPWLLLLGENGTGKSTVLKSLCMSLCDANYFQNMLRKELVNPNNFIRHGSRKGTIKVWITGNAKPRILEFKKNLVKFTNTEGESVTINLSEDNDSIYNDIWSSPNYLLAYGATRLLPRGSNHEAKHIESQFSRLDNLFNPFVPLVDAEKWLLSLSDLHFRRAAIVIKDLLRMSENDEIPRTKKDIKILVNGNLEMFKELSDGYQSVIALTADILQLVMDKWKNPDEARGIVLLDEIGAHLHPRWKMVIVNSLRKALPNMQFIVSTHQPLCLRGVDKGEVVLMRRDSDKNVEVITDLPNPKELRISQILTSVFGLSSTMDPELEAEFNRYYELRAINVRTDEEEEEMNELRGILNPDLLLGETLLETQVYNVVKEKYNQYKNDANQDDVQKLKADTLSAVQELWSS